MTTIPFAQPGTDEGDALAGQLAQIIRDADANAPRSLQKTLGPSDAGVPCDRRVAYGLLDWPRTNTGGDPWPPIVGTAAHAWLAAAFNRPELGGRFLVEQRLTIAPPYIPGGSCDLYDTWGDTVIDWKVVGDTSMRTYKREGPRAQYIAHAHLYGLGWERAGRTPKEVALAFLPRGGLLSGLWVWKQPYDRNVAVRAIARVATLRNLIVAIDPEAAPANWSLIPATADHGCAYCPWYRPGSTNLSTGCPGNLPPAAPNAITPIRKAA